MNVASGILKKSSNIGEIILCLSFFLVNFPGNGQNLAKKFIHPCN